MSTPDGTSASPSSAAGAGGRARIVILAEGGLLCAAWLVSLHARSHFVDWCYGDSAVWNGSMLVLFVIVSAQFVPITLAFAWGTRWYIRSLTILGFPASMLIGVVIALGRWYCPD